MKVRPLPPALRQKAEKELNENAELVAYNIQAIKEWLRTHPNFKHLHPTDQWILTFLRGSKFNLEKCKDKLEMYYNLKSSVPEYYDNRDPFSSEVQDILELGGFLPLRKLKEDDGPRICISRIGELDPAKHKLIQFTKVAFMIIEVLMLEDDNFSVAGQDTLIDMANMKLSILWQWTPSLAKKTTTCFTKALPLRMKGVHIINSITGFETAYMILKLFLGEKLRKRFQVYSKGNKALFNVASEEILPAEYGGVDGSLAELRDYWKAKVESYRDWFVQGEDYKAEENQPDTQNDTEICDSLKTLEID